MEQDKHLLINVGWSDKAKKLLKIKINKNAQTHVTLNDEISNDLVIVDKIYLTNDVIPITQTNPITQIEEDKVLTGDSIADKFTNKDSIIYFMANISIIRPSKKYYNVIIDCTNSKGEIVYEGTVKRSLSGYSYKLGNDLVKGYKQTLGLNPKLGAMIKDQKIPLVDGQNYYIKLFVENKLISITKFSYEVVSESPS